MSPASEKERRTKMANSYNSATMYPTDLHLSKMHVAFLEASYADLDKNPDGTYYVYWEDNFQEAPGQHPDQTALQEALSEKRITSDEAEFLANSTFEGMLRRILQNNPNHTYLRVEGSFSCSKMRPGSFGGQVLVVTRTHYAWMGTWDLRVSSDNKIRVDTRIEEFPTK